MLVLVRSPRSYSTAPMPNQCRMYQALGAEPDPRYNQPDCLRLSGLTISFQALEDYLPPTWPEATTPKQVNLDLFVDSVEETEALLHRHGAVTAAHQPHRDNGLVVMRDPAGHPFCIANRV